MVVGTVYKRVGSVVLAQVFGFEYVRVGLVWQLSFCGLPLARVEMAP